MSELLPDDPLNQLIVDENQPVNRDTLARLLMGYITLKKGTWEIDFTEKFRELPKKEALLLLLSAIKVRNLIDSKFKDEITPSEIIKMEIMAEGTVKSSLKILSDAKDIKVRDGKYSLPNYKIPSVAERLNKLKLQSNE
ncbi:TPA: hypothetical protein DCQ22_04795 [Candidatus Nomurabacteria bacterium]|nr:hypothetical protein [Candidatus Nomurabacteria bacterium]